MAFNHAAMTFGRDLCTSSRSGSPLPTISARLRRDGGSPVDPWLWSNRKHSAGRCIDDLLNYVNPAFAKAHLDHIGTVLTA